MSEILDEAWHATARSPREEGTYAFGLDVLGAGPTTKPTKKPPATKGQAIAAGKRAIAAGNRLARRKPRTAQKLISIGRRAIVKAQAAPTGKPRAVVVTKASVRPKTVRVTKPAIAAAVHRRAPISTSLIRGDEKPVQEGGGDVMALYRAAMAWAYATDAVAQAGELMTTMVSAVDPLKASNPDAAKQGQDLIDQLQAVIDSFDPEAASGEEGAGVPETVAGIKTKIDAFLASAKKQGAAPPVDGGGGDEGGGGGEPPGGEAEEGGPPPGGDGGDEGPPPEEMTPIARYRASGGTWDPFEDEEQPEGTAANPEDYQEEARALLEKDEEVVGNAYHFEWYDILNPAGALIRTYQEEQNKTYKATPMVPKSTEVAPGTASSETSKKLTASQKKLADLKRQLAAQRQARIVAARAGTPTETVPTEAVPTSTPEQAEGTIMGEMTDDVVDLIFGAVDEGVPLEEAVDIATDAWNQQITDEAPDFERGRASAHRGAAYMQEMSYPPYGASSGQEGGSMRPKEHIEVFGSMYDYGLDAIGAGPVKTKKVGPRAGFVVKTTPSGRKFTSLTPSKKTKTYAESIKNARDIAKRAQSVGKNVLKKLAQAPTKIKGATPRHAALTAAQIKITAQRAIKAGAELEKHLPAHEKFNQAFLEKRKGKSAQEIMKKSRMAATRVKGYDEEEDDLISETRDAVLGAYCEVLGDETAADAAATDQVTPPTGKGGPPDYGVGPAPTKAPPLEPGYDYSPDPYKDGNDPNVYDSDELPLGAVVYDGSHGMNERDVASQSFFFGADKTNVKNWGLWGRGCVWTRRGTYYGRDQENPRWMYTALGDWEVNDVPDGGTPAVSKYSVLRGWGPLVGNPYPEHDWTKGLRYDVKGDRWFWYRDSAPAWATTADDQKRLNQAILDYKALVTAAAADAASVAAADKLEKEQATALSKQQAGEDAATARRQDQEQKEASHQDAVKKVEDERQARLQAVEDEHLAKQAQAQAEIDAKAAVTQAEIEAKATETAAKLRAMIPIEERAPAETAEEAAVDEATPMSVTEAAPDYESGVSEGSGEGGGFYEAGEGEGEGVSLENVQETLLGNLHGSARLKARVSARRD